MITDKNLTRAENPHTASAPGSEMYVKSKNIRFRFLKENALRQKYKRITNQKVFILLSGFYAQRQVFSLSLVPHPIVTPLILPTIKFYNLHRFWLWILLVVLYVFFFATEDSALLYSSKID